MITILVILIMIMTIVVAVEVIAYSKIDDPHSSSIFQSITHRSFTNDHTESSIHTGI